MRVKSGSLRVRRYRHDDFEDLVAFYEDLKKDGSGLDEKEVRFLRVKLSRPGYDPEKDLLVLSGAKGFLALSDIVNEPRISRAVVDFQVRREHLFREAAAVLMEPCLKRCAELEAERIHVCLAENDQPAQRFFEASGFKRVRIFLGMKADLRGRLNPGDKLQGARHASLAPGEEACLQELQNGIFAGSWGFCPNTVDEIKYYLALTGTSIKDILFLREGDELAGYSWMHESPASAFTIKEVRIHMFGIKKKFRGKGLGGELLRLSLDLMGGMGFRVASLTVDAGNKPACALYAGQGFRIESKSFWLEKEISL